jgi:hypothetical protein
MSSNDGDEKAPGAPPFSAQDALSFMQKMWNPLGMPIPGFGLPGASAVQSEAAPPFPNPAMMFAALDPAEIDRKVSELRIVENWLSMSLNLMQMSIKTLELQRASLEAFSAAQQSMHPPGGATKTKPGK